MSEVLTKEQEMTKAINCMVFAEEQEHYDDIKSKVFAYIDELKQQIPVEQSKENFSGLTDFIRRHHSGNLHGKAQFKMKVSGVFGSAKTRNFEIKSLETGHVGCFSVDYHDLPNGNAPKFIKLTDDFGPDHERIISFNKNHPEVWE